MVEENLDQYQPPDRTSVYILVFVTVLLNVFAFFAHTFVYPGLGRYSHKLNEIDHKCRDKTKPEKRDGTRVGAGISKQGAANGAFETADDVFYSKDKIDAGDQSKKPAVSTDNVSLIFNISNFTC